MREILFRGKRKDNGEWVEGNLIHQTEYYGDPVDHYHILYTGEFHADYYDSVEVIPETVGQFTGLVDKNGFKIFEGDIVKTKYGRLCVVIWFSSSLHDGWDLETVNTVENIVHTKAPDSIDLYKKENLEVISNIHDGKWEVCE